MLADVALQSTEHLNSTEAHVSNELPLRQAAEASVSTDISRYLSAGRQKQTGTQRNGKNNDFSYSLFDLELDMTPCFDAISTLRPQETHENTPNHSQLAH